MRSMFLGLEIGRRAIMTQQTALDVTGHNVANANTEGYSRQVAVMVTTPAYHSPALTQNLSVGQIGTGVKVSEIRRLRDGFVDMQVRDETNTTGYWQALQTALDKIEAVINEPSDEGLRGVLDNFWQAWQDLSESPENESVRQVVAQRGMAVADTFHHIYNQLQELREDLNSQVKAKVDELNSYATQIADLNLQIQAITIAGKEPNDLKDRRDLLLDQLAKIVDAKIVYELDGMVTVMVGGTPLVQGITTMKVGLNADTNGIYKVVWDPDPSGHPGTSITGDPADDPGYTELHLKSGELLGLLEARGPADHSTLGSERNLVPDLMNRLNLMAKTVVMTTNALHRAGYSLNNTTPYPDGLDFFKQANEDNITEWAKYIQVADEIVSDPKNIAAALNRTSDDTGNPVNFGDGANALKIAQLKHTLNRNEYWTASDEIDVTFPDSTQFQGNFTVRYGGVDYEITMSAPAEPYQDFQEVVNAISGQLEAMGLNVGVRAEGKRLVFYSSSDQFQGVTGGTFPASGFSNVAARTMIQQVTVDDYWRSQVSSVGVISQEATRMVENQEVLLDQLEAKRQATSGVSLDEEMVNMIKFQHAYNAAARYITVIDEAVDVIVNRMGVVGR